MQNFKFYTFSLFFNLLIFGLLISTPLAFGMQKQGELQSERLENKMEVDEGEGIGANETREAKTFVEFVYDENGDFYRDQLYPFITEQKSALNLRQTCKCMNLGFCKASKIYKPILVKEIDPYATKAFLVWLENHKDIEFCVTLRVHHSLIREFKGKDLKKIFKLLGNRLGGLDLFGLDAKIIDINDIQKENITILKIGANNKNIDKNFFENLISNKLQILILKDSVCNEVFNDAFLENLPPTLKKLDLNESSVTGECFCKLPNSLEKLSLSLYTEEKYLKDLPKSLKHLCFTISGKGKVKFFEFLSLLTNLSNLRTGSKFEDKDIEHLPKNLKVLSVINADNLTGIGFKNLPKNLRCIKFKSLEKIDKQYLNDLPKSVSTVYAGYDTFNHKHEDQIKILRENGIKVEKLNYEEYLGTDILC